MSFSITTKDSVKAVGATVDGIKMQYRAPGAGIMLDMSKVQRKSTELQKKVDDGSFTDTDMAEQEKLYELIMEFYNSVLKDETKDNSKVRQWLRNTPMDGIAHVITEFQKIQNDSE